MPRRARPADGARDRLARGCGRVVDAAIVNIAFPNIERTFTGTLISSLSWVLNAYNIVFAASGVHQLDAARDAGRAAARAAIEHAPAALFG